MEKNIKKNITPDINEELMMNMMVDGVKKEGLEIPETDNSGIQNSEINEKTVPEKKAVQNQKKSSKLKNMESYGQQFLVSHSMKKRGDKTIYIEFLSVRMFAKSL